MRHCQGQKHAMPSLLDYTCLDAETSRHAQVRLVYCSFMDYGKEEAAGRLKVCNPSLFYSLQIPGLRKPLQMNLQYWELEDVKGQT